MKARWRLGPVSRHRSYLALKWPTASSRRVARVALIGDVWDQPRTIAVELMTARELDTAACSAAHQVVRQELDTIVPQPSRPRSLPTLKTKARTIRASGWCAWVCRRSTPIRKTSKFRAPSWSSTATSSRRRQSNT